MEKRIKTCESSRKEEPGSRRRSILWRGRNLFLLLFLFTASGPPPARAFWTLDWSCESNSSMAPPLEVVVAVAAKLNHLLLVPDPTNKLAFLPINPNIPYLLLRISSLATAIVFIRWRGSSSTLFRYCKINRFHVSIG